MLTKVSGADFRLRKEFKDIEASPDETIELGPDSLDDLFQWTAKLHGPKGTPYEGGFFFVDIKVPKDYPFSPPRFRFTTKLYHCNIDPFGGVNTSKIYGDAWSVVRTL